MMNDEHFLQGPSRLDLELVEVLQGPLGIDLEGGFDEERRGLFLILRDLLESFRVSKLQGFGELSSNLGVEKCICEF
ncbi:hypothetical protein ACFX12_033945 [Malus domestica]